MYVLLLLLISVIADSCNARLNEHDFAKLKRDLLKDYNRLESPENKSEILISSYFYLNSAKVIWKDTRIKWNPSDYGNITYIRLQVNKVWTPTLAHIEKIKSTPIFKNILNLNRLFSTIYSDENGMIHASYKISLYNENDVCEDDFKNWPRDKKVCKVLLSFPLSLNGNVSINTALHVKDDSFYNNNEWRVAISNSSVEINNETTDKEIVLLLHLERRSYLIGTYVVTPMFVIHIIALFLFWLEPRNPERIVLEGFLITCHFEAVLMFSFVLPHVGDETPHIVTILAYSLFVMVGHFIITVLSRRLIASEINPPWLSAISSWSVKSRIISWIFFHNINDKIVADILEEDEEGSLLIMQSKKQQKQLQILSHLLNFIAFVLSIPLTIVLLLAAVSFS